MSVQLYISSVSSNREVRRKQQRVEMILQSKKIPYETVDIAVDEEAKARMREGVGDAACLPPRFFNGDTYLGGFEQFDDAVEDGAINTFLGLS